MFHDGGREAKLIGSTVLDETLDVGRENEFVHVEADKVAFATKVDFGDGFSKFGFTDTGGAEEKEGANGAVFVFDAGSGTTQGV